MTTTSSLAASPKTFLITGVSSGFGQAFAQAALAAGHRVVGTVRNLAAFDAFERAGPNAHPLMLDIADHAAIEPAVADVVRRLGPIDVLINNAGYGHEGILEESSLDEMKRQFDVNVFGAVAMIKAVLPSMRERRAGRIVNMTSMGGFITMPGIACYCGSKFALEGITEVLAQEVKAFGIGVTAVAPGSFRTDWAGRSMLRAERSIADYDAVMDPIRQARLDKSGRQAGDPARAAQVVLDLVDAADPPVHLLLGSDALGLVRAKLHRMNAELSAWEPVTVSTDFA